MRVQTPYGELRIDTSEVDVSSTFTAPSMPRKLVAGRTSYTLDGEPISEERAKEIIDSMRREQ